MVGAALIFSFDTYNVYLKFRYLPEEKIVFEKTIERENNPLKDNFLFRQKINENRVLGKRTQN